MKNNDFPALNVQVNGKRLAYLDNASTTQKPQSVIDTLSYYYQNLNANIHRGVHYLSEKATEQYELAREKVKNYINAEHAEECIFVRGTTEAINLVAFSYGQLAVKSGDEILITQMEHHANIVPWKMLCERTGAQLRVLPINHEGELILDNLDDYLRPNTKMIAVTHISNSLGTINPIKEIINSAHNKNIPVLIDGAQSLAHLNIDVQELDCDFYTLSAHKAYGPMGIGVLYAKKKWLEKMPPYQGGGDMILKVTFDEVIYNDIPYKFEAGTQAIADAIGFGAAIDYLASLDKTQVNQQEEKLLSYALSKLKELPGIKFYGQARNKIPILSFTIDDIHPHDIGTILNENGVAVRTGHHCNMPLMDFFGISGTVRASMSVYNTTEDIDQLYDAIIIALKLFKKL